MKKLILILVMALFASFQLFSQGTVDDPPTCTGSASAPAVGVLYTYEVNVPTDGGYTESLGSFTWYVMDQGQVNLLTGTHILNNSGEFIASGYYDAATVGASTIDITWTSAALATGQPYYLVVVYNEVVGTCNPGNNMKVYRIAPQNTFWLAMNNVTTTQCAAAVSSAVITNTGDPGVVEYLYGTNTLEITVTAGGYTGLWDAVLQLGGFTDPSQTVAVTWVAAVAGTNGVFTPTGGVNGTYTATLPSSTTGVAPNLINETITITIVVTNNHFENLLGQTIALAIDGSFTSGATTFDDLSDVNGNCTAESPFADAETQTIAARPTIAPVNPPAFVPQVAP